MNNICQLFFEILSQYLPNAANAFGTPANSEILDKMNKIVMNKLPKDFLDFYRTANGEAEYIGSILGFELMPIENIMGEHEFLRKYPKKFISYQRGKIKEGRYNSMWLPIASDGGGSFLAIDLDPGTEGNVGQIITLDRESNISYVIAASFRELLLDVIPKEFANGNFDVDDEDKPEALEWVDGHYFNHIKERFL